VDTQRYAAQHPWGPGPWATRGFDVEGHRGARGLVVENTIPSFRAAIDVGVTGVELDVRLTADGHVVVWHDATLDPEFCVFGEHDLAGARVDELTLAQLRTVDVGSRTRPAFPRQRAAPGERIVTLPELLQACADATDLWWTIELKVDPTEPREVRTRHTLVEGVLAAVHHAGVGGRCFVHSFDWATLESARELDPGLLRSALAVVGVTYAPGSPWLGSIQHEDFGADLAGAAAAVGAQVVSPLHSSCDEVFVARAHALGLAVLPWTVNADEDLLRMRALGVDGLVTDDPDRAVALLRG